MNAYDEVIIGGGHNGLTCASYLARAGRRVLVLERRDILGGACVTEEVWPGYRVSTAAYLCSLLHPRIIEDLELAKYGFEVYRRETGGFAPFPDGSCLMLHPEPERTRAELLLFCPEDMDAYFEFEGEVEQAADVLEPFFLGPSPSLGQIADSFERAGIGHLFIPFFTGSVRSLLDSRFKNERLKAVLATDGLIGTDAGISTPGTAYVLLHHYMGQALGARGLWGYVRGGMGQITQALATDALTHGAEVQASAEVARIVIENDRAVGVTLANGEEVRADHVLSNADPVRTYGLVDGPLPESATKAIAEWRTNGVSCKINLAVTDLPDFTAMPGTDPGPEHLGTVHICPSLDYLERAWEDAKASRPSTEPMIEVYIQTATDRSLAPEGRHILSCFTQYFPYGLAERLDPDAEAEQYADRVIEIVSRYAPNVPAGIESRQILTPQRLEERFGLTGGHIFHGDITPDQMFGGRAGSTGPETAIPGLYLCGSGAWPGGCVSGLPGYNAAQAILQSNPSSP